MARTTIQEIDGKLSRKHAQKQKYLPNEQTNKQKNAKQLKTKYCESDTSTKELSTTNVVGHKVNHEKNINTQQKIRTNMQTVRQTNKKVREITVV